MKSRSTSVPDVADSGWITVNWKRFRAQFATEEERRTAGVEHFRQEYGQEFVRMEQDAQVKQQKAQRFAQALRFICPTHYIPGKQEWGAF